MTPVALLSIAVSPHTPADAERMGRGLRIMMAEDPTLGIRTDALAGEVIIGTIGERQLDIVVDRLAREFHVSASVGRPHIEYRERLMRAVDGERKVTGTVAGRRLYAHVKLRVAPREPGAGNLSESHVTNGAIPTEFMAAVHEGVQHALDAGGLAAYPLIDVKVTVYDGSYHHVDSSAAAFMEAAYVACREAALKARPVVVEPVMRIQLEVPEDDKDNVVQGLFKRRVQLQRLEQRHQTIVIYGVGRLADLFGYAHVLRDTTRGRGSYTLSLHGYEPVPPRPDQADSGGLGVREPLRPRPTPRSGSIALPLDDL